MRAILLVLSFVFSMLLSALPGHAQNRVALVIGNSAYRSVAVLPNPQNDAADIAAAFQRLGFSVRSLHDATFDAMRRALVQFGREAQGADMAVVYFAGHGMEIGGENWLIPVDAELRSDRDAESEAISLKSVILQVSNAASLGLVILDSCRDNPFAAQMQRVTRSRAVDRGLARIEPTDNNVLVAYGAKDGTVASDGRGRNSPFTAALLNNLEKAGVEIRFLLASVRDEVLVATNRVQQPFVYGSLSRQEIYLKPPAQSQTATAAPPVAPASPSPQQSLPEAERAWAEVRTTSNMAALEAFVRRFPDGFYADLARVRIEELKKAALASQPAAVPPRLDEERQRQEALRRQQEEQKRQEALRQQQEEQKRQEALRRQQEEQKRQEALRQQQEEQKRQEALRQQQEEQKRQEALRQQQEEQKRQEAERQRLAALESPQQAKPVRPAPALEAPPVEVNLPEQIRRVQTELYRLGCYRGKPDGSLNDETRKAIRAFLARNGEAAAETGITEELIANLRQHSGVVCNTAPSNPPAVASRPPASTASHPPAAANTGHPPASPESRPPAPAQASSPNRPSLGTGF